MKLSTYPMFCNPDIRIMVLWLGILGAVVSVPRSDLHAATREFDLDYGERNTVRFESSAVLETIEGRTSGVKGTLTLDPARVNKGAQARFEVDLTKLRTGIAKRDGHMRGPQYLDTAKFPIAVFTLTKLSARKTDLVKAAPEAVAITLHGQFELHGVTRDIRIVGKARYIALTKATKPLKKMGVTGDAVHFRGGFDVKLDDHGITIPRFLGVKIADTVRITVDVFGFAPAG